MVKNTLPNAHLRTFASAIGRFKHSDRYIVAVSPNGTFALLTDDLSAVAGAPSLETLAGYRIRAVAGKYKDCWVQLVEQTRESFRVNVLCKDGRTVMTCLRNKSVGVTLVELPVVVHRDVTMEVIPTLNLSHPSRSWS